MKHVVDILFEAQPRLRRGDWDCAEQQAVLRNLRGKVPQPVLAHYLRALASDRNGVGLVSHGVCGECHLRVPAATAASLAGKKDIYLCENCGCYLLLLPEEASTMAESANQAPAVAHRRRGRPVAVAV